MEKLGILVIRGSGGSGFKPQEKFVDKVNNRLKKQGFDVSKLEYEYIDWYAPMEDQQALLLQRMFTNPKLRLKSRLLRRFLITNITDLINYGGRPNKPDHSYAETHKKLHESIIKLKNRLDDNTPLVILASSMGTEIINNYIWDRQKASAADPYGGSPFERFETLVGLFTMGNNIPIFSTSMKLDELKPIQFPTKNMEQELKDLAVWENYFDKNDPLGYPIKFINDTYDKANVEDIQIPVGNIFSFWNILSHFGYWTSKKLQKRIAGFVTMLFDKL